MANSPRRVYWDACTWIALIQREKIAVGGSDRDTLCRAVIAEAKKNKIPSAILGNVSELHTFDGGGEKKGLLDLDQKINRLDGGKLRICTPDVGGTPFPLLSGMQNP
jgi:hypothetical protein